MVTTYLLACGVHCSSGACKCHYKPCGGRCHQVDEAGVVTRRVDDQDDFGACDHTSTCTCETCVQNHPEREILYGP